MKKQRLSAQLNQGKVFDSRGKSVWLSEVVGRGGEAIVYRLRGQPNRLAKIYEPAPRPNYPQKLAWMVDHPPENPTQSFDHASLAWPSGLLFDARRSLVGYQMPYIQAAAPILDVFNPRRRAQTLPRFDRRYLHRTARNLAAALSALHACGYVVGDLNESNVLVTSSALVTLIDTDSFQVQERRNGNAILYHCPVAKLEYTPPELQNLRANQVERLPEHDSFALAVLIFQLLMEGNHPFRAQWLGQGDPPPIETRIAAGSFPYITLPGSQVSPPRTAPNLDLLHPELVELVRRCFVDGHRNPAFRPSPMAWERALSQAERSLVTCSLGHLYSNHLTQCPFCSPLQSQAAPLRPASRRKKQGIPRSQPRRAPLFGRQVPAQGSHQPPSVQGASTTSRIGSQPLAAGAGSTGAGSGSANFPFSLFPIPSWLGGPAPSQTVTGQPAQAQRQPGSGQPSGSKPVFNQPSQGQIVLSWLVRTGLKNLPGWNWPASQWNAPPSSGTASTPSTGTASAPTARPAAPASAQPGPASPSRTSGWSAPLAGASWKRIHISPRPASHQPVFTWAWAKPKLVKSLAVGGGLGALAGAVPGAAAGIISWSMGDVVAWALLWALGGVAAGLLRGYRPGYRLSLWVAGTIGWRRFWQAIGLLVGGMLGGLAGFVIGWWAIIPVFLGLIAGARIGISLGHKIWELGNRLGWERIWAALSALSLATCGWYLAGWLGASQVGLLADQGVASLAQWLVSVSLSQALIFGVTGALGGALGGAFAGTLSDLLARFFGLVD